MNSREPAEETVARARHGVVIEKSTETTLRSWHGRHLVRAAYRFEPVGVSHEGSAAPDACETVADRSPSYRALGCSA